jgi:hypothetical protein
MRPISVDFVAAQDLKLRVHHFAPRRALFVDFHLPMKDQLLTGLEAALKIAAVEKLAWERTGVVLHQQMVDGVAAVHAADRLAAHNAGAQGVGAVGLNVFNFGEMNAVFIAKREIVQQVL